VTHKVESERDLAERQERSNVSIKVQAGTVLSQVKECHSPEKLEKKENRFSPRAYRGSTALLTRRFLSLEN
jgi:hypothetical protein